VFRNQTRFRLRTVVKNLNATMLMTMMTTKNATTTTKSRAVLANNLVAVVSLAIVLFAATTSITTTEAFVVVHQTNRDIRGCKGNAYAFQCPQVHPVIVNNPQSQFARMRMRTSFSTHRKAHNDNNDYENEVENSSAYNTSPNNSDGDDYSDNSSSIGLNNLMKDTKDLVVGDWIVAKRDVPALGIRAGAVYKLISIYLKGGNANVNVNSNIVDSNNNSGLGVEVVPLQRYGDDEEKDEYQAYRRSSSYTKYLRVYNPRDHGSNNNVIGNYDYENDNNNDDDDRSNDGVVVTPEEIGLVSVKADWTEAMYLAVPGFFWIFVAMSFSNYYTDRYGGSFWDAFFRT